MAKAVPAASPNSAARSAQPRPAVLPRGDSSTTPRVATTIASAVTSDRRSPRNTTENSATWMTSLLE